jgi:hypothetical protein
METVLLYLKSVSSAPHNNAKVVKKVLFDGKKSRKGALFASDKAAGFSFIKIDADKTVIAIAVTFTVGKANIQGKKARITGCATATIFIGATYF